MKATRTPQPIGLLLRGIAGLELHMTLGRRTRSGRWIVKAGSVELTFDAADCVELCPN